MIAWTEAILGEVLADATPGFACGDDVTCGVFQFRMNNITSDGQLDLVKRRRVPLTTRNIERFLAQPGDVLFNATNSLDLVGKSAHFPGIDEPAVFSNHILRLRPGSRLDGRFLSRWLNLQFQHGRFRRMCRQWVNQATVNRDALLSMRIPLPSLADQCRIADTLDKADLLRAKRRAAIAQLDALTEAIFLGMFGDPGTNPKGWRRAEVGNVASVQGGLQVTTARKNLPREVPYLRVANVYRGFLDLREIKTIRATEAEIGRTRLERDDFLIVEGHGNPAEVGRGALWDGSIDECVHQNHLIRVRFDRSRIVPRFGAALLNSVAGRRHLLQAGNTTSGLNTISVADVRATPLLEPPWSMQQKFATRAAAVETHGVRLLDSAKRLDALFASLQHRAFRGEL